MFNDINKLLSAPCRTISSEEGAMNLADIQAQRELTSLWHYCAEENELRRTFHFDSYMATIRFVNKIAEIAEANDHHPDLFVNFKRCKVAYSTHTVNGVTINDFICVAKIDQLIDIQLTLLFADTNGDWHKGEPNNNQAYVTKSSKKDLILSLHELSCGECLLPAE